MACSPLIGMNYGQAYLSGLAFNAVYVDNELTWLWNQGVRTIRTGGGDLGNIDISTAITNNDTTGLPGLQVFLVNRFYTYVQIAQAAKAKGFKVIFAVTGTSGLNDTTWSIYTGNVAACGGVLWNSGSPMVDDFQVGNELELITSGPTSLQSKVGTLATSVKTNNFISDGTATFVSYAHPQGTSTTWIGVGLGGLDRLAYNGYNSGSGSFDAEMNSLVIAFGKNKVYWGEWNVNSNWPFTGNNITNQCENIEEECVQLYTRLEKIKSIGVLACFFCFSWPQNSDAFSLWDSANGRFRKWTDILFNRVRLETTTQRYKNTIDHGSSHDPTDATRRCRKTGSNLTTLTPNNGAYTLSVWIYPTSFSGAGRIYEESASGSNGTTGSFSMQVSGSAILIQLTTSTGTKISSLSSQDLQLRLNQWNHVVWRDNGGRATVYINNARGLRIYNYSPSGTYLTDRASVGIETVNNFNSFQGRIDELAIFPSALTWAQIRQLYEQGDSNLIGLSKNLYLKFDAGSGTTVSDSSGNSQDFTLASATGSWVVRPAETTARSTASTRTISSSSRVSAAPLFTTRSSYTPRWTGLNFNYGHDTQIGVITATRTQQINADLDNFKAMGIKKIRVAMNYFGYSFGITAVKAVVVAAKARGFYVIWGVDGSGFAWHTDLNWRSYVNAVKLNAAWAQANGVDEFMVGNEIEYSQTVTGQLTNAVPKIKKLAAEVKNNIFFRTVSYAVAQDALESEWIAEGKGYLDKLGYNVYGSNGDFTDWQNKITTFYNAFGSNMYISEWNLHATWSSFPQPESAQATAIETRAQWLQDTYPTLEHFFFTGRWDDNSGNFALYKGGTVRLWFASLFS